MLCITMLLFHLGLHGWFFILNLAVPKAASAGADSFASDALGAACSGGPLALMPWTSWRDAGELYE